MLIKLFCILAMVLALTYVCVDDSTSMVIMMMITMIIIDFAHDGML